MNRELAERIEITSGCRDADDIPKVPDAGRVFFHAEKRKHYQVMHNGIKVFNDSHYGEFNTQIIANLRGHHEPQEERVFFEVLKRVPEGGVMVELGSFWAYYSMWFAQQVSGATNYMIEPMVVHHGIENFALNGLETGNFVEACVGRKSKTNCDFVHWDGSLHQLPQWAVDDFVREHKIDKLDILHSDIQGAELEMLQGASKTLADGNINFLFISTHGMRLHENCLELLQANGYGVIAEHSPLESFSVDGLIAMHHGSIDFPQVEISRNPRRRLKQLSYRLRRALRQRRVLTRSAKATPARAA